MAKNTQRLLPDALPWAPPPYDDNIVYAIRALASGTANKSQQVTAWEYLMFTAKASDAYADLSFRPDGDTGGQRGTDFAEGKRFVGLMMRRLLRSEFTPETSQVGIAEDPVPSRRERTAKHLPDTPAARKRRRA